MALPAIAGREHFQVWKSSPPFFTYNDGSASIDSSQLDEKKIHLFFAIHPNNLHQEVAVLGYQCFSNSVVLKVIQCTEVFFLGWVQFNRDEKEPFLAHLKKFGLTGNPAHQRFRFNYANIFLSISEADHVLYLHPTTSQR